MSNFHISFMEHDDIQESANVLSIAMLNNPIHIAVFQGAGENEREELENDFIELFNKRPGRTEPLQTLSGNQFTLAPQ